MNKKQIFITLFLIVVAGVIGIVKGLKAIRTGVVPAWLDAPTFLFLVVLSITTVFLARAFSGEKGKRTRKEKGQK